MTIRESAIIRLKEENLTPYAGIRIEIPADLFIKIAQNVYRDVASSVAITGKVLMEAIDNELEGHGYTIPGEKQDTELLIDPDKKPENDVSKLLDGIDQDITTIVNSGLALRFQIQKLRGLL